MIVDFCCLYIRKRLLTGKRLENLSAPRLATMLPTRPPLLLLPHRKVRRKVRERGREREKENPTVVARFRQTILSVRSNQVAVSRRLMTQVRLSPITIILVPRSRLRPLPRLLLSFLTAKTFRVMAFSRIETLWQSDPLVRPRFQSRKLQ